MDANFSKTSIKVAELLLYPNPAQNSLFVKMSGHPQSTYQLEILNSMGEKISKHEYATNQEDEMTIQFDMSNYPNGLYFIRATVDGNKIVKSFSINK
ncbi:MAG: T9SS type A sorting domain-containing protein [Saprospiraceae bacterium]|nr:T9SS type A sorting domain-containing protein [Candidatus Vicinibacter affinis]